MKAKLNKATNFTQIKAGHLEIKSLYTKLEDTHP